MKLIPILVIGVIGISLGFVVPAVTGERHLIQIEVEEEERSQVNYIDYTNHTLLVSIGENVCIECHLSGKKFIPQAYDIRDHAAGGMYCLKCHRISHEKHPVNGNVTCEKCHGSTAPSIPSPSGGEIACNDCHGFPDALLPSSGNLITIHQPRGVSCIICHTDCTKCHSQVPSDEKWDKRMDHFKTLLKTYKQGLP